MTRTIFVTGAAGFIGSRVARQLRERGDDVVAVVRDPSTSQNLRELGVRLVASDLGSEDELRGAIVGSDAVIHVAGVYRIGIPASERPAMLEANVGATQRVLDAAIAERIPRIVDVSTVNILGDTHSQVLDETSRRDLDDGFLSYYDETKYKAHLAAEHRAKTGAPIIIAMPGTVYGRGDHSGVGAQLRSAFDGTLPYVALGGVGVSPVLVEDIAAGILAALDRGAAGESYILGGRNMRFREAMAIVAKAGGHRLPRVSIPDAVLRLGARMAPNAGGSFGLPPNLTEILRASAGVTYWGNSAKAARDLGYAPRDLEIGARDAYGPV